MRFIPGVDGDKFYFGLPGVFVKQPGGGLDGGEARLAEGGVAAVVKDDVGSAVFSLILGDFAHGAGCDLVCANWLSVAGNNVPLDRSEAEFAGGAQDVWAAGPVRCAEVAD